MTGRLREWVTFEPPGGWAGFARSGDLTDALWAGLPDADWVYLNLTSASSIWESRRDASVVCADYAGDRVVHLSATAGAAADFARRLAGGFGLVAAEGRGE